MQPTNTTADLRAQLERTQVYLAQDPDNLSLLARGIDLALALGDAAEAQRHADHALALKPGDPYFRFRAARASAASRDWEQAVPALQALLDEHADANIASALAQCLIAQGRHEEAAGVLVPFGDDAELSAEAAVQLVRSLHHAGRLDEAKAIAARHAGRLSAAPAFCAAASLLYLDLGELDAAARLAAEARAGGAAPIEALVVQGSLALTEDTARAAALFDQVLAVSPEEGRSWAGLGMASMMKRDFDTAQTQLERARKAMPHHVGTMHLLAWSRLLKGDLDGAQRDFAAALDEDRNFGESHGGMAVAHAMRGERAQAEREIELALRLDPESLSARYAQMVLSGVADDPERFSRLAVKLLARRPMPGGGTMAHVVGRHAS
jgi:tetratricopeptide (TPR) repeat protein